MINKILNSIELLPTMMDVEQELTIIRQLMSSSINDILANENNFIEILDALQTSHTQSIFQVNEKNYTHFENFSKWLINISNLIKKKNIMEIILNVSSTMRAVMN